MSTTEEIRRLEVAMSMHRESVYAAIDSERDYQDSLRDNGRFASLAPSLAVEIICIDEQVSRMKRALSDGKGVFGAGERNGLSSGEDVLDCLRKISALCVRAMETHGTRFRK